MLYYNEYMPLKVGSCPNDGDLVKNTFAFFCVTFKKLYFLNLLLPRTPLLKIDVFLSLIFFAQTMRGIPVLKKVVPHVHKSVTSGVSLNKPSIFSGHEVSWRSRYGG